ncbi:MAG TPA: tetratricopeptide repeat protein [Terriglobales bacterium]|jgi:tetratricopeptide (TPR) repeat protein|nr:tetratricopeptide repeat protein [Terriglobales bacterium]
MKRSAEEGPRRHTATRAAALLGLAIVLSLGGCNKLKARDQLNKGVQSYKNARYEDAIAHFQKAVALDPKLLNARLYLATAYAQRYVPGADTPENNQIGQQAIDEYKKVLQVDPRNINSIKGIASLYFNMKKFDQAKEYHEKAKQLDPNDPEEYYSIAVIDWTQSYAPRQEERAKLGLKADEPLKDKKVCEALRDRNLSKVNEGLQNLKKALELRPDYDDAMAYTNLLYREKADLECGNPDARMADLKTADEWVDKTMATKKAKAERLAQKGGGITTEQPK